MGHLLSKLREMIVIYCYWELDQPKQEYWLHECVSQNMYPLEHYTGERNTDGIYHMTYGYINTELNGHETIFLW